MDKHDLRIRSPHSANKELPEYVLDRDRDIVQMAKFILAHIADVSSETAHALLTMASRRNKQKL